MRNGPTTYYIDANGQTAGFEYDLARQFAERQGWRLTVVSVAHLEELFDRLRRNEVHLAAAGLTVTETRRDRVRFGPSYNSEREVVVCGNRIRQPQSFAELSMLRLEVVAHSSHIDRLNKLREQQPDLTWITVAEASTEAMLERVANGLADCAVTDKSSFEVAWNYLPSLAIAFEFGEERDIAWATPPEADPRLSQVIDEFFADTATAALLLMLRERYFAHVRRLSEADVLGLLERRARLLPELRPHFHQAQIETGLDWRFLAALAYQESQWNAAAISPTGVRGIMMLTSRTADHLGVKNRLDPRESILGGARYMVTLKEALPESVPEPDRTWMALAAYNLGPGSLIDARRLTLRLGRNPNLWKDVKDVLPLLARPEHAMHLRHGFARGGEARTLAENVRIYYDILSRYEAPLPEGLGSGAQRPPG